MFRLSVCGALFAALVPAIAQAQVSADRGGYYAGVTAGLRGPSGADANLSITPRTLDGYTYSPSGPAAVSQSKATRGKVWTDYGLLAGHMWDRGAWAWAVEATLDLAPLHQSVTSQPVNVAYTGSKHPGAATQAYRSTSPSAQVIETYTLNDTVDVASAGLRLGETVGVRLRAGYWVRPDTLVSGFVGVGASRGKLEATQASSHAYTFSRLTRFNCGLVPSGCVSYLTTDGQGATSDEAKASKTLATVSAGMAVERRLNARYSVRAQAAYQKVESASIHLLDGRSEIKLSPSTLSTDIAVIRRF